jgi:peptidyl-prolyl cis-trans isomerase C
MRHGWVGGESVEWGGGRLYYHAFALLPSTRKENPMIRSRTLVAWVAGAWLIAAPQLAAAFPDAGKDQPASPPATADGTRPLKEGASLSPDTPVAVVNGTPITKGEFDRAMEGYLRQFQKQAGSMHGGVSKANDQMKADVLRQLVDRELLYQESMKQPATDVEEKVQKEFDGYRGRFPSDDAFDQALAAQGLDVATLRDLMGRQVQVRHYLETQVVPGIELEEEGIRKFYDDNLDKFEVPEQVKARHILIRVEAGADEATRTAAREKTAGIYKRCVAGEDFAALAKEFSEDPGSAPNGGDLGFFPKERMVPPFAEAAFALEPGQISEPVETRFGYHIIQTTERKAAGRQEFDEVKEPIANYLRNQALDQAVKARVASLRETAKGDVMAPHM